MPDEERKEWALSYYVVATEKEAQQVYDAIQTLLCTCEFEREKDNCRVPVSGMHLSKIDPISGDATPVEDEK